MEIREDTDLDKLIALSFPDYSPITLNMQDPTAVPAEAAAAYVRFLSLYCLSLAVNIRDFFFKTKLHIFLDTLIVKIHFLIIKINNFPGDLSNVSTKTATLVNMTRADSV